MHLVAKTYIHEVYSQIRKDGETSRRAGASLKFVCGTDTQVTTTDREQGFAVGVPCKRQSVASAV